MAAIEDFGLNAEFCDEGNGCAVLCGAQANLLLFRKPSTFERGIRRAGRLAVG
jgi:hypothetical protein